MVSIAPDFDIGISTEGERLAPIGDDFSRELRELGIDSAAEVQPSSIKAGLDWAHADGHCCFHNAQVSRDSAGGGREGSLSEDQGGVSQVGAANDWSRAGNTADSRSLKP
jgi:hypothetical protein